MALSEYIWYWDGGQDMGAGVYLWVNDIEHRLFSPLIAYSNFLPHASAIGSSMVIRFPDAVACTLYLFLPHPLIARRSSLYISRPVYTPKLFPCLDLAHHLESPKPCTRHFPTSLRPSQSPTIFILSLPLEPWFRLTASRNPAQRSCIPLVSQCCSCGWRRGRCTISLLGCG